jgi:Mn2+/Fe2+ NRAMP family transporter
MAISNLVALFIVITTAATLHAHGMIQVQTSAQAAEALRAVAGPLTFVVFAVGIIGTGMPALPGSAVRWARRSPGMSISQSAAACQGALRDHRGGRGAELLRHRSDPGALLERGAER